jgi:hypothetical protein
MVTQKNTEQKETVGTPAVFNIEMIGFRIRPSIPG